MTGLGTRPHNGPMKLPAGLSFEISDLILAGFWSAVHGFEMRVRLDHGVADEECEEVIEFRRGTRSACRCIMWRTADAVYVQPIVGKRTEFACVADALKSLVPKKGRPPK